VLLGQAWTLMSATHGMLQGREPMYESLYLLVSTQELGLEVDTTCHR